jgi:protein-disulfide isomerase
MAVCVESNPAKQAVSKDLAAGKVLNISGTPTYVVSGQVYPGRIPKEVIDSALSKTADAAR